jgi:hypothetical protein
MELIEFGAISTVANVGAGEGNGAKRRITRSPRLLLVVLTAFLFTLQSLGSVGAHLGASEPGQRGTGLVASLLLGPNCSADSHAGKDRPAHGSEHVKCCLLCEARCDGAAPCYTVSHINEIATPQSPRFISLGESSRFHVSRRPIGWASSWSSQAPPAFS